MERLARAPSAHSGLSWDQTPGHRTTPALLLVFPTLVPRLGQSSVISLPLQMLSTFRSQEPSRTEPHMVPPVLLPLASGVKMLFRTLCRGILRASVDATVLEDRSLTNMCDRLILG